MNRKWGGESRLMVGRGDDDGGKQRVVGGDRSAVRLQGTCGSWGGGSQRLDLKFRADKELCF